MHLTTPSHTYSRFRQCLIAMNPISGIKSNMAQVAVWLALGFAVCIPNYRGSLGFGSQFAECLIGNCSKFDVEDCAELTKQVSLVDEPLSMADWAVTAVVCDQLISFGAGTCRVPSSGFKARSSVRRESRRVSIWCQLFISTRSSEQVAVSRLALLTPCVQSIVLHSCVMEPRHQYRCHGRCH
jgi:hypothetical protein